MRSLRCDPGDDAAASQVDGWLQDSATSRDPALRQRIILTYLGLPNRLAGRYRHSRGTTPEDLRQTARAGLIPAVDRYDPTHGTGFVPFAVASVVGELIATCATPAGDCTSPGHSRTSPAGLQDGRPAQQALGRSPTTGELAKRLQMAEEQVLEALAVAQCRQALSLDRPVGDDIEVCLGDLLAASLPVRRPRTCCSCPSWWPRYPSPTAR